MIDTQSVFELLPVVHRLRDADRGRPLEALVATLAEQADVVDLDIELLYDNWFIETCDPWLIPYIGDLLAVRPVYPIAGAVSQRSYVANTIRYRRRKGTVSVLERLAADVTGWPAKAVEFFQLLATTQYVNHLRLENLRTPDLRDDNGLELLGGPLERVAHTGEVRRIASRGGRYDIPNVGLYLWRLASCPLGLDDVDDGTTPTTRATARRLGDLFTFNPLGLDAPLFNDPSRVLPDAARVEEEDVPAPLRRRGLLDELEGMRRASLGWATRPPRFFTERRHVVRVWAQAAPGGPFDEIPVERILVADLSLQQLPPTSKSYPKPEGGADVALPIDVAIDPRAGRLTFPSGHTPSAVEVAYAYGLAADIGGGLYERRAGLRPEFVDVKRPPAVIGVGRDAAVVPGTNFPTLTQAVQAWNAQPAGTVGVIVVFDSRSYDESLTAAARIELPERSSLLIVAGERPAESPDAFAASGVRPHVKGDIEVVGTAPDGDAPGHLQIDGVLLEGSVTVLGGNLGSLRLSNCTIAPRTADDGPGPSPRRLVVDASPAIGELVEPRRIEVIRTITGPVSLADDRYELVVDTSVVDGGGSSGAIDSADAGLTARGSTVFGDVAAKTLEAENSIFDGTVVVARTQSGCVRFCFVPADPSCRTPRRYRCQPDLALDGVKGAAEQAAVIAKVRPAFSSRRYGDPAYAQLDLRCAPQIRTGADDGSEMGVFTIVKQPQREANARVAFGEYLPFGLEAGWFYVT